MKKPEIILIFVIVLIIIIVSDRIFADVITFQDNITINGDVIKYTKNKFFIDYDNDKISVSSDKIFNIRFENKLAKIELVKNNKGFNTEILEYNNGFIINFNNIKYHISNSKINKIIFDFNFNNFNNFTLNNEMTYSDHTSEQKIIDINFIKKYDSEKLNNKIFKPINSETDSRENIAFDKLNNYISSDYPISAESLKLFVGEKNLIKFLKSITSNNYKSIIKNKNLLLNSPDKFYKNKIKIFLYNTMFSKNLTMLKKFNYIIFDLKGAKLKIAVPEKLEGIINSNNKMSTLLLLGDIEKLNNEYVLICDTVLNKKFLDFLESLTSGRKQ